MSAYVVIACDGEENLGGRCFSEDSPVGMPRSATEARKRLGQQGWHRTRDGRDLCPGCWSEGQR